MSHKRQLSLSLLKPFFVFFCEQFEEFTSHQTHARLFTSLGKIAFYFVNKDQKELVKGIENLVLGKSEVDKQKMCKILWDALELALEVYLNLDWNKVPIIYERNLLLPQAIPQEYVSNREILTSSRENLLNFILNNEELPNLVQLHKEEEFDSMIKDENAKILMLWWNPKYPDSVDFLQHFRNLAIKLKDRVDKYVMINAKEFPTMKQKFQITHYPALLFWKESSSFLYPQDAKFTESDIIGFITDKSDWEKKYTAVQHWQKLAKEVPYLLHIRRPDFRWKRTFVSVWEMYKALKRKDDSICILPNRDRVTPPPTIILLGGGMGAGKSSILIQVLSKTKFWRDYYKDTVIIEADSFQTKDPLNEVPTKCSQITLHNQAVQIAETLFLSAIHDRRDIIFDGTLMWSPFVLQTIDMIRNSSKYKYQKGPGYIKHADGTETEEYWKIESEYPKPKYPYRIKLFGVTVDADTAVRRAILRKLTTGREVPIPAQLNSHKLFSINFPTYAKLVDQVKLYDNNQIGETTLPILIAWKKKIDDELQIQEELYHRFLNKIHLNPKAVNYLDLYKDPQSDVIKRHNQANERLKQTIEQLRKMLFAQN